jgi:hypothetical protein
VKWVVGVLSDVNKQVLLSGRAANFANFLKIVNHCYFKTLPLEKCCKLVPADIG